MTHFLLEKKLPESRDVEILFHLATKAQLCQKEWSILN